MKIYFHHTFLAFVVLFLAQGALYAQESGSGLPDNDVIYGNVERDDSEVGYILIGDPEGKSTKVQPIVRDTLSTRSPLQKTKPGQETIKEGKTPTRGNAPDDDSILSFNFLYFFIQKYKLQDIID